jgi:hypothetical protein
LRTKGMKLSKRGSRQEISQTKEIKPILWTCTVSAPEMTVMLYSLNGLVLYHVSSLSPHENKACPICKLLSVEVGMLHYIPILCG